MPIYIPNIDSRLLIYLIQGVGKCINFDKNKKQKNC